MNNELSAGATLSHYRIVSKIGAGGMGEVYLAQDTKLDRKVALKILPAEVAANRDRMDRFVREAKSAAALNHPNIATIHEIGEHDGTHYIAMEFIDGDTLLHKIHREKAPLSKLLKYLIQVAQGLAKAHAAGIVHRDLKPDNIMITSDDYAKVLDFGLAKLVEPQRTVGTSESGSSEIATAVMQQPAVPGRQSNWDSGHSTPGMVMGTIGYMSPEQASGRVDEIDLRSDIFSFGCILFEAVTGQRAFAGKDVLDSLHKIVHAPTPQLKDANPLAPVELQRVVRRCLAKEPAKRYQSIREVAIELDDLQEELKNLTQPFLSTPAESSVKVTTSGPPSGDGGFWVAVLPFKFTGSNVEVATLAEGLSEDIVTGLSRFSYLRVITRSSTMRFAGEAADVRTVGKELGARYVMTGSLRLAGSLLRVAVQLVDASSGANLWAENYERPFRVEEIFASQDELVPKIVATAADRHGVLPHSMSEALRNRDVRDLRPDELVLRGFTYYERATATEHPLLRAALERAVEQEPGNGNCWALLAIIYCDEHKFGLNPLPDPLGRAFAAAQKAVEVAVSNSFAYDALAQAHFFRREFESFRNAAERAIALNPLDGATVAWMGTLIAFSGDWEHGCDIVQRAMHLNPHHPGWYWSAAMWNAYRKSDFRAALSAALKFNLPGNFFHHQYLAMVYGQLGEREAARKALAGLISLSPDFALTGRGELGKWLDPELVEHAIDGLRKAGLEILDDPRQLDSPQRLDLSSEKRANEAFWVAVLPFKATGTNTELSILAEGLSDEIITGLNRFSYLRVIARISTFQYASQMSDVRSIGKSLGARYVMEGNLRQAGTKMRLAVQLVDATTGIHLWAENYERTFSPESIFELQDELVPRIVSTIADSHGVLPRSMSEGVQSRTPEELSPYEALLRSFNYTQNVTPAALSDAVSCLELAVQKAPAYADAWAMLGVVLVQDYAQGYNVRDDSLRHAEEASRKAVELAPSNHLAWASLARVHFFQKEQLSFRNAAEKAVALNSMDGDSHAALGEMLAFSGDVDRGLELVERAKQLNPNHPGWYWYVNFFQAYKQHDYRAALNFALKVNLPGHWAQPMLVAVASAQLGEKELAAKALSELLKLRPDAYVTARKDLLKWWNEDDVEHLFQGLRKAGLDSDGATMRSGDAPNVESITASSFRHSSLIKSIAVLPFQNLSGDPEQEYFADGLAEELLNALAKIDDLKVAARTSAFSFKGRNAHVSEIGERLGVKNILEGSVRKSGNRLRISVQLVNASDGFHLWSERYDREMQDIFELQDEITLSVTDALKVKLLGEDRDVLLKRYTDDTEAYELFLKGRYYHYKYSAEGWRRAIEFFERAIEKEPNYAPAYAGMNTSLGFLWFLGFLPAAETVPQMKAAAMKALEIDENLAEAHLSQAMISFFYDWKWEKAEQEFQRAIALDPHNAEAISFYSMFLGFEERFEEAIDQGARALAVDPLSTVINMNVGWTYFAAGLFDKALDQIVKMTEVEPDFYGSYWLRGAVYLSEGEYEKAVNELKKAVSLGGRQVVLADLGAAYGLAGRIVEATTILGQLLEMRQREYVPAICMARIYSRIGENDKAIDWLEKAFEERNGEMVFLKGEIDGAAAGDALNSLGSDPRLIELLQKMQLPQQRF